MMSDPFAWLDRQEKKLKKVISKHIRAKLTQDKAYQANVLCFIRNLEYREKVKLCMDNDLDVLTMQPYQYCKTHGM